MPGSPEDFDSWRQKVKPVESNEPYEPIFPKPEGLEVDLSSGIYASPEPSEDQPPQEIDPEANGNSSG